YASGGGVLKTVDGGSTWTDTGVAGAYAISCPTVTTCWAVSGADTVVTTSDGGMHWSRQPFPSGAVLGLSTVSCPTTARCYAAAAPRFFRYVDEPAPPVTAASLSSSGYHRGSVFAGPVSIALAATGGDGGVTATSYRIDGGADQSYGGPFSYDTEGSHTL